MICYSVQNAASVRVTPRGEDLKPSINHCFAVSLNRTTTYRLDAVGMDGSTANASFRNAGRTRAIAISAKEIQLSRGPNRENALPLVPGEDDEIHRPRETAMTTSRER